MADGTHKYSVERYLGYLDKEMTIMGILSGFCVAALAVSVKLFSSKDSLPTIQSLPHCAPVSLGLAHLLLLLAGLAFYRQRSLLAWYYGQISLEDSGYPTKTSMHKWLEYCDAWDTWMNYQRGFWFLVGAFSELIAVGLACARHPSHWNKRPDLAGGLALALLILVAVIVQKRILQKWAFTEDPYLEFRKHPTSIF